VKFLVDAQLPRKLALFLTECGHDAIHTLDLPRSNRTPDEVINEISLQEHRVVISKDSDFVDTFLLFDEPWKLLLVSTGNISNRDLNSLFKNNVDRIAGQFDQFDFIEINQSGLVFHS